jgi:bifunctional non-homologous end joining protein LigD
MLHQPISTGFIAPMLPTLVVEPPEGDAWSHEIKYDGYRTLVAVEGQEAHAFTRKGYNWTEQYRPLVAAAQRLRKPLVLDGEVVVQDEQGRSDFSHLKSAIAYHPDRLYAFDLISLGGKDLRATPLIIRRAQLEDLIGGNSPGSCLQFSAHVVGNGAAMFEAADQMGLEGIVSKKLTSRYRSGRTLNWLKIKCMAEGEFIVIGTERGVGPTTALLARETAGGLEYAGSAAVTLAEPERALFWEEMEHLKRSRPALPISKRSGASWVTPAVRLRVRYLKGSNKLRHASVRKIVT